MQKNIMPVLEKKEKINPQQQKKHHVTRDTPHFNSIAAKFTDLAKCAKALRLLYEGFDPLLIPASLKDEERAIYHEKKIHAFRSRYDALLHLKSKARVAAKEVEEDLLCLSLEEKEKNLNKFSVTSECSYFQEIENVEFLLKATQVTNSTSGENAKRKFGHEALEFERMCHEFKFRAFHSFIVKGPATTSEKFKEYGVKLLTHFSGKRYERLIERFTSTSLLFLEEVNKKSDGLQKNTEISKKLNAFHLKDAQEYVSLFENTLSCTVRDTRDFIASIVNLLQASPVLAVETLSESATRIANIFSQSDAQKYDLVVPFELTPYSDKEAKFGRVFYTLCNEWWTHTIENLAGLNGRIVFIEEESAQIRGAARTFTLLFPFSMNMRACECMREVDKKKNNIEALVSFSRIVPYFARREQFTSPKNTRIPCMLHIEYTQSSSGIFILMGESIEHVRSSHPLAMHESIEAHYSLALLRHFVRTFYGVILTANGLVQRSGLPMDVPFEAPPLTVFNTLTTQFMVDFMARAKEVKNRDELLELVMHPCLTDVRVFCGLNQKENGLVGGSIDGCNGIASIAAMHEELSKPFEQFETLRGQEERNVFDIVTPGLQTGVQQDAEAESNRDAFWKSRILEETGNDLEICDTAEHVFILQSTETAPICHACMGLRICASQEILSDCVSAETRLINAYRARRSCTTQLKLLEEQRDERLRHARRVVCFFPLPFIEIATRAALMADHANSAHEVIENSLQILLTHVTSSRRIPDVHHAFACVAELVLYEIDNNEFSSFRRLVFTLRQHVLRMETNEPRENSSSEIAKRLFPKLLRLLLSEHTLSTDKATSQHLFQSVYRKAAKALVESFVQETPLLPLCFAEGFHTSADDELCRLPFALMNIMCSPVAQHYFLDGFVNIARSFSQMEFKSALYDSKGPGVLIAIITDFFTSVFEKHRVFAVSDSFSRHAGRPIYTFCTKSDTSVCASCTRTLSFMCGDKPSKNYACLLHDNSSFFNTFGRMLCFAVACKIEIPYELEPRILAAILAGGAIDKCTKAEKVLLTAIVDNKRGNSSHIFWQSPPETLAQMDITLLCKDKEIQIDSQSRASMALHDIADDLPENHVFEIVRAFSETKLQPNLRRVFGVRADCFARFLHGKVSQLRAVDIALTLKTISYISFWDKKLDLHFSVWLHQEPRKYDGLFEWLPQQAIHFNTMLRAFSPLLQKATTCPTASTETKRRAKILLRLNGALDTLTAPFLMEYACEVVFFEICKFLADKFTERNCEMFEKHTAMSSSMLYVTQTMNIQKLAYLNRWLFNASTDDLKLFLFAIAGVRTLPFNAPSNFLEKDERARLECAFQIFGNSPEAFLTKTPDTNENTAINGDFKKILQKQIFFSSLADKDTLKQFRIFLEDKDSSLRPRSANRAVRTFMNTCDKYVVFSVCTLRLEMGVFSSYANFHHLFQTSVLNAQQFSML
jgi:hypothetical protein